MSDEIAVGTPTVTLSADDQAELEGMIDDLRAQNAGLQAVVDRFTGELDRLNAIVERVMRELHALRGGAPQTSLPPPVVN